MITALRLTETISIGTESNDYQGIRFDAQFNDRHHLPMIGLELIHFPLGIGDPTNAQMTAELILNGWPSARIAYARLDTDFENDSDNPDRVREFADEADSALIAELRGFNPLLDSVVFVRNITFSIFADAKADALRQAIDGIMFDYLNDELGVTMIIDINRDDAILVHAMETYWEHEIGFTEFGTTGLYRSIPKVN